MYEERKRRLGEFVEWAERHVSGDEKGEAQVFLDRLMQAFGQKGMLEVGGQAEFRVKRGAMLTRMGTGTMGGFGGRLEKPVAEHVMLWRL